MQGIWGCHLLVASVGLDQCLRVWRLQRNSGGQERDIAADSNISHQAYSMAEQESIYVQVPEPAVLCCSMYAGNDMPMLAVAGRGLHIHLIHVESEHEPMT